VLVVDEVYAPFDGLVDDAGVFGRSARRLAPNIIAIGSLTKCYGLAAERVGWLIAPESVVEKADDAILGSLGAPPAAHARLGLAAFAELPRLAVRAKEIVGKKRHRVARWVQEQGYSWSAPAEGLFGYVSLPSPGKLLERIERAARTHDVLVAPGAFFGDEGGFRIGWSLPEDMLEEGLARLANALAEGEARE
jgi:aspartate/methionine/tyrosine aminotransferase